ncbi:MAG: hydrogenase expression/formation protein HypE, partial [Thermoplasmata archaeon]|nr:hydrogenase expression/formation protein HypE [Thermoplasmata archaeon]
MNIHRIKLAHGAGGEVMQGLIKDSILKHLANPDNIDVPLEALDDSAVIDDIVFTTDSHTVQPLFFPGGDIGTLSVCGTVNDIAVMGAEPIALSLGFIIEEGFLIEDLDKILSSIGKMSTEAGVPVVTGDTKVVERGALQQLVTNTSGLGKRTKLLDNNIQEVQRHRDFTEKWLKDSNLQPGDKLIVSGYVGDHGIALLSFREGYSFESEIQSDIWPLNKMIALALKEGGIVAMKDPTRGGLANTLHEWSAKSKIGIKIEEDNIPIREGVLAACEMLGIEALNIGNEGKAVIGVV